MRDPQLNSAECITEGHQPNISSVTEHSWRIIVILVLSFLFSIVSGPLLAFITTKKRDELKNEGDRESKDKKNSIDFLCGFLLVIFVAIYIAKVVIVYGYSSGEKIVPINMYAVFVAIQPIIVFVGIIVSCMTLYCCGENECMTLCCCGEDEEGQHQGGHPMEDIVKKKSFFFIICANLATYHFCWLLVGIMLNPIWGLVVLLVLCLFIGVSTFAFYTYKSSVPQGNNLKKKCLLFSLCFAGFLAICVLIVIVILAGQSYNGRQTADEALKEAVMYLISIFFSWLYWKGYWLRSADA